MLARAAATLGDSEQFLLKGKAKKSLLSLYHWKVQDCFLISGVFSVHLVCVVSWCLCVVKGTRALAPLPIAMTSRRIGY